jgi:hypothetical protein
VLVLHHSSRPSSEANEWKVRGPASRYVFPPGYFLGKGASTNGEFVLRSDRPRPKHAPCLLSARKCLFVGPGRFDFLQLVT